MITPLPLAILAYEAEYEETVRLYRIEQFKLASEDSSNRPEGGKDRVTVEDLLDGEGQQLEQSKRPSEGVPDRSEDGTDGAVGEDSAQGEDDGSNRPSWLPKELPTDRKRARVERPRRTWPTRKGNSSTVQTAFRRSFPSIGGRHGGSDYGRVGRGRRTDRTK